MAILATMPRGRKSAAWNGRGQFRALRYSTLAHVAMATGCWPMADASCALLRAAKRSPMHRHAPMRGRTPSTGLTGSIAVTSAGVRWPERGRAREEGFMNVIADLFPEFAEHRTPTEDAEIFVPTGGSGPPLALYGFPQTHMCEDDRVGAGSDLERDEANLPAGGKLACPTFVPWGSAHLGRAGPNP